MRKLKEHEVEVVENFESKTFDFLIEEIVSYCIIIGKEPELMVRALKNKCHNKEDEVHVLLEQIQELKSDMSLLEHMAVMAYSKEDSEYNTNGWEPRN